MFAGQDGTNFKYHQEKGRDLKILKNRSRDLWLPSCVNLLIRVNDRLKR